MAAQYLMLDSFYTDKPKVDAAEALYFAHQASAGCPVSAAAPAVVSTVAVEDGSIMDRLTALAQENMTLKKVTDDLVTLVKTLEARVAAMEIAGGAKPAAELSASKAKPAPKPAPESESDDDDIDLFGSDSDDEEAKAEKERVKQERLAAYAAKKSKKPGPIAKSSILLDVKPWDDETDMAELEKQVRTVQTDGLLWGAGKLVPVGYGIKKLQILCTVEDDKVGTDFLEEQITAFEDLVQSVDIAAFNKI